VIGVSESNQQLCSFKGDGYILAKGNKDRDYLLPVIQKKGSQHSASGQATDNLSWEETAGDVYVWELWGFRWRIQHTPYLKLDTFFHWWIQKVTD